MKSKAIAIETILLLLIGILVVGTVVYMVYRYTAGKAISEQECRTAAVNWCSSCKAANWPTTLTPTADLDLCAPKYFATGYTAGRRCDLQRTWCSNFISTT